MKENHIPLGQLLDVVSREIRDADERARQNGIEPTMRFTECEIDCAIDVEHKEDGSIDIWVLKLGGDAKRTEKNTIKVKYTSIPDRQYVAMVTDVEDTINKQPRRTGKKVENDTTIDETTG